MLHTLLEDFSQGKGLMVHVDEEQSPQGPINNPLVL